MRIAVVGGTGTVGRLVVAAARGEGYDVTAPSRSTGVDVVSGRGLAAALDGVDVVVDVTNVPTLRREEAVAFFSASASNLQAAAHRAGARHLVALSIVGVDRVDMGYYVGKRVQERLLLEGPVPATVLRSTQWYEFPRQLLDRARGPLAVVPRMRVQPVAAREVAAALVEAAAGPAVGRATELAGPERMDVVDMARLLARRAAGRGAGRRVVVPLRLPGPTGRALAGGALLPGPGARLGRTTFAEWFAATRAEVPSGAGR